MREDGETMEPGPSLGSAWCLWEGDMVFVPSVKRKGHPLLKWGFWASQQHACMEGERDFERRVIDGKEVWRGMGIGLDLLV